ncbi:helix-turn-helix domain-containing protein [Sphingomonas sp.]|uniref:helix-turn-helix domain-containing protein n=1 Tax=Sphingomonas sp. TaxID=28214 RepID=UPI003CC54070
MIVADELQRVGDALDQVGFADDGRHGRQLARRRRKGNRPPRARPASLKRGEDTDHIVVGIGDATKALPQKLSHGALQAPAPSAISFAWNASTAAGSAHSNCGFTRWPPVAPDLAGSIVPRGRLRSTDARDAVLEAAFSLMSERGFDAMSMEGVAARAGVGKATVYR